ncbi:pentapeptide repeat-containing protein [Pectobacterium carotovorum]|uniref:pentapeptide repeat-containing protein n=1 Tax=Pectobacterium carotovorum TaxID=554 RepID=UPI00191D9C65|nr:pentapeptide repeat-containing protein [Pectobacterium carotovorum]MBL0909108.1 pentapeptide repeat-containing protein [Pectobacterium carotovorum]
MEKLKRLFHATIIAFLVYTIIIVAISALFPFLSRHIFSTTHLGIYNHSFWVSFLINANSSILDFLVIGVIIYFLDKSRERKEKERERKEKEKKFISEMRMDLEDYASHSTTEINLKKLGIIKRLMERGERKIDIQRISLKEISIKKLQFNDSDLTGINFEETRISDCIFTDCNLRSLNFNKSKAKTLKFENCKINNMKLTNGKYTELVFNNCDLKNSTITNSVLPSCIFNNCNMEGVLYTGSDMRSVNFKNSTNISPTSLSEAKCIDYIVAEKSIIDELKILRKDVKFRN